MLILIYGLLAFFYLGTLVCASDEHSESDSDSLDLHFEGNFSNCEPIILTGSTEERSALVEQVYNMEIQNENLAAAQEAASLCAITSNTTISTHFEQSNAITLVIHVESESDERYSIASGCLLKNFKGTNSIRPGNAILEEILAEENCDTVRRLLWWLDIAELKDLAKIRRGS